METTRTPRSSQVTAPAGNSAINRRHRVVHVSFKKAFLASDTAFFSPGKTPMDRLPVESEET
ncbi:hypothetical protein D3C87_1993770 [compost metagenome]